MQHEWVEQVLLVIQTALALAFVFEIVKPDTRSLQGFGVVCEMEAGKVAIRSDACQSRLLFHAWVDGPIRVRRAVIIAESNQRPDLQAYFLTAEVPGEFIANHHGVLAIDEKHALLDLDVFDAICEVRERMRAE